MATYLYGLVPARTGAPSERGVNGGEVSVRRLDADLAVLCSGIDERTVDPRRAHLEAHDRVLAAAMVSGPVLPLRFGVITDEHPRTVLAGLDGPAVVDRMRHLDGKVEVQILWEPDGDVALRRVADRHPEVRDRGIAPVDRGRAIAEAIAQLAVQDLLAVAGELTSHLVATGPVEARGSSARVAALVEAEHLGTFLEACEQIAERVVPAGTLRTVGALPPYSFAALERDPIGV